MTKDERRKEVIRLWREIQPEHQRTEDWIDLFVSHHCSGITTYTEAKEFLRGHTVRKKTDPPPFKPPSAED